ncbi:MFS transporter [Ramlibacter agri]|uniref:MFS transporter n=1 Tax=Ramlibacter agri TaxID=2728837 RepID=UPI00315A1EA2
MAAILGAGILVVLDGSIANVALPAMAASLHAAPADAVWITTAYQLAVVMFLLPASALGDSLGYRRVFVGGVALFTAASLLCALAPTLPLLVAARCLQGLGAAAVMPLGLALLRFTYPRAMLARAISWNALAVAGATATGPALGAFVLSVAGWPWLFAANLPIGALVLAACRWLPRPEPSGKRIDGGSVALNATLFASFVLASDRLAPHPWQGIALYALSLACAVSLVRRERRKAAPLVPLDLLRVPSFRASIVASVCCFTAQMAGFVALSFYLQHVLGQGPAATGLWMTPWPVAVMLAAPLSARLAQKVPTALLCAAGAACLAAGLGLCAMWPLHGGSALPLSAFTSLAGFGFGLFQTPNNQNMLLAAPRERSGAAGGAQGTARLTGLTLGSLLMSLLFGAMATPAAVRCGLAIAAAAAIAGSVASLLRHRDGAAQA